MDRATDLLTIGQLAERAGCATSAVRYYESLGLVTATRTSGGQRRFRRETLRRIAFIRAAQNVGLSLEEIREALTELPGARTPTKADWSRVSATWRSRLDRRIDALVAVREGLTACIGCGCLSLRRCSLSNPQDVAAAIGPGARYLPEGARG